MAKGDIARALPHDAPRGNGSVVPMAGRTIADQLRDAAVASSIESAEAISTASPLHLFFGEPQFRLPDGVAREYNNPAQPNRVSRKLAIATFVIGGIMTMDASIYMASTTKPTNDGPEIEDETYISIPGTRGQPALKVLQGRPDLSMMLETWKFDTITAFDLWLAELQKSTPANRLTGGSMVPRHVKVRKQIAPAPAA